MKQNLFAFDLETTGRSPQFDRIIEIGAYNVKTKETFSVILNPEKKLSPKIIELTHITQDMVDQGENQRTAILKFMEFLGDNFILLGHNLAFDIRFLAATLDRLGIKIPELNYIDTLTISRATHPELDHHKLGNLCELFHINNKAAHRAFEDAEATAKVYKKLLREAEEYCGMNGTDMAPCFEPKTAEIHLEPATEKQIAFINSLQEQLGIEERVEAMSKGVASSKIGELLKLKEEREQTLSLAR